jgi:hypothetical protein
MDFHAAKNLGRTTIVSKKCEEKLRDMSLDLIEVSSTRKMNKVYYYSRAHYN